MQPDLGDDWEQSILVDEFSVLSISRDYAKLLDSINDPKFLAKNNIPLDKWPTIKAFIHGIKKIKETAKSKKEEEEELKWLEEMDVDVQKALEFYELVRDQPKIFEAIAWESEMRFKGRAIDRA